MLCGVGNIGGDHDPLRILVETDDVGGSLHDDGGEFFKVCYGAISPVQGRRTHVDHHLPDRCCGWSFMSTLDDADQLMEIILIYSSDIQSICCEKYRVGDFRANDEYNRGRYCLLYPNCREPCGILLICLVLSVGICCDFGGNDVDCSACPLRLGDGLSLDIGLLDGNVGLKVGERVRGIAADSDHAICRFLKELLLEDAVDLFDQCYRGVVFVSANVVLSDQQLLYLRFHAYLYA